MNAVKAIREMLGETQAELAAGIAVSQGSVSFYEAGRPVMPDVAFRLIEHAKKKGVVLGMDHVYGLKSLPAREMPIENAKAA